MTTVFTSVKRAAFLAASCLLLGISSASVFAEESEYSFTVHNKTNTAIKQILVSEDGEEYGKFDIGKGIGAGKKVTLVWDTSTNNEACKQFVKAVYADDSESEPSKFNFCEKDLEIEFEE